MPQTGQRWAKGSRHPSDFTGSQGIKIRQKLAADKAAASEVIDIEAVKRAEFKRGFNTAFDRAFDAGVAWLTEQLVNAGVNVGEVLALDADEAGDDHDDEGEDA